MLKNLTTLRFRYAGDTTKAKTLNGLGKKCVYLLAEEMGFRELQVLGRTFKILNTVINVNIVANIANVLIYVPEIGEEVIEAVEEAVKKIPCYILIRMRISQNWKEDINGIPVVPPFPNIPESDKCILYDVVNDEINTEIGIVNYNDPKIAAFKEKHVQKATSEMYWVRICGQEAFTGDSNVNPDGTAVTRLYDSIPESPVPVPTDTLLPITLPDSKVPYTGTDEKEFAIANETEFGMLHKGNSYQNSYSEAWVGIISAFDTQKPVTYRLDYIGDAESFDTSFQVLHRYGEEKRGVDGGNAGEWAEFIAMDSFEDPPRTIHLTQLLPRWNYQADFAEYEINTPIGNLGKYKLLGSFHYIKSVKTTDYVTLPDHKVIGYKAGDGKEYDIPPQVINGEAPFAPGQTTLHPAYIDDEGIPWFNTQREYRGANMLPGYPQHVPPWTLSDGASSTLFIKNVLEPQGYPHKSSGISIRGGVEYGEYKEANVTIYDSADTEANPTGSHLMTQIYTCQMRQLRNDENSLVIYFDFRTYAQFPNPLWAAMRLREG